MATVTPEQMKKALSSLSALEGMASGYCELQDGFDTSKGIAENVRQVLAALAATPAEARTFPIQSERGAKPHPTRIPWWLADLAYSVYRARFGSGQSLERLAERGGFHPSEMDEYVPDWRDRAAQSPPASDPPSHWDALAAVVYELLDADDRTDLLHGTGFATKLRAALVAPHKPYQLPASPPAKEPEDDPRCRCNFQYFRRIKQLHLWSFKRHAPFCPCASPQAETKGDE